MLDCALPGVVCCARRGWSSAATVGHEGSGKAFHL